MTLYLLGGMVTLRVLMEIGPELFDGTAAPTFERYWVTVAAWPLIVVILGAAAIWYRVLGRS